MIPTSERKKNGFAKALLPSFNADLKKYDEIYQLFCQNGYSKELCDLYSDTFVDNCKKPLTEDIIQLASLYDKIHDHKNSEFYLDMLIDKKLSNEDKYAFCIGKLNAICKLKRKRDSLDFRTENINFIQTYMQKKTPAQKVDMYIALALVDCTVGRFSDAFSLLRFDYKPQGKNDSNLLKILTTAVYFFACQGDEENMKVAVDNAKSCLKLFKHFDFDWCKDYYEKRIDDASSGIL